MVAEQLARQLSDYERAFMTFIGNYDLLPEWFETPDHIALKCADAEDYARTCTDIDGDIMDGIWEIELDGRLLGSGRLAVALTVAGYSFDWLEIMQPRPGKETGSGFVEHTEFYIDDFDAVTRRLSEQDITYELQENPGHRWVNIVIDDQGREIKFNNKVLADVVIWEQEQGYLRRREV